MKYSLLGLLCVCVLQVSAWAEDTLEAEWIRVTADAGWQPRDSQGELVFDNKLWILGGWFDSFQAPPRDVWSSSDGCRWERVTAEAPWKHSDLPMTVVFRDRMWLMGGWYNGRLPGHSASCEVWESKNGSEWSQVTAHAPWSPRLAAALVEFKGRMWLLGGTENYYFGDAKSLKNDVWSSEDGEHWTCHAEHAEWSPRAYHQAVVLNGKLYVMGGGNYVPEYHAKNDVWVTDDGEHWQQVAQQAPWPPRLWFSAAACKNRMWVVGGWSNHPSKNWNDVWWSTDGASWQELKTPSIWKERHEHSLFVRDNTLWVAGGHAQPLSSEVWKLDWRAK